MSFMRIAGIILLGVAMQMIVLHPLAGVAHVSLA